MRKWLIVIVGLVCLTFLSCRSFVDKVTPVNLDEQVKILAEVDSNDFGILGPTLYNAKSIKNKLIVQHREEKLAHVREIEDIEFIYPFALGILTFDIEDAEQWQQVVIGSEDNPVSILGILAALGLTGVGTVIGGRYIKRPNDLTPEEHQIRTNTEIGKAYEAGLEVNNKKNTTLVG